ncbi:unnamed protein product [Prorocentrum cordatum]|uniref:Uncharacterized protein n=1 Tax=Prorocentrum cordatum TaxID=2364126 RepID=A0ABN9U4N4_9DINO|nr:unnamed protein product [Polarella glacialis]
MQAPVAARRGLPGARCLSSCAVAGGPCPGWLAGGRRRPWVFPDWGEPKAAESTLPPPFLLVSALLSAAAILRSSSWLDSSVGFSKVKEVATHQAARTEPERPGGGALRTPPADPGCLTRRRPPTVPHGPLGARRGLGGLGGGGGGVPPCRAAAGRPGRPAGGRAPGDGRHGSNGAGRAHLRRIPRRKNHSALKTVYCLLNQ